MRRAEFYQHGQRRPFWEVISKQRYKEHDGGNYADILGKSIPRQLLISKDHEVGAYLTCSKTIRENRVAGME